VTQLHGVKKMPLAYSERHFFVLRFGGFNTLVVCAKIDWSILIPLPVYL